MMFGVKYPVFQPFEKSQERYLEIVLKTPGTLCSQVWLFLTKDMVSGKV